MNNNNNNNKTQYLFAQREACTHTIPFDAVGGRATTEERTAPAEGAANTDDDVAIALTAARPLSS